MSIIDSTRDMNFANNIEVIEYWPNGNIKKIYEAIVYNEYIDQKEYKKIIKCGEYKEWHIEGQLCTQTSYLNNELHGEYRKWYPDGQLCTQTSYLNGKLHGEYRKWYNTKKLNICYKVTSGWEDGKQLAMKTSFINGNLDGYCRKWNLNRQATTYNVYKNGELIK